MMKIVRYILAVGAAVAAVGVFYVGWQAVAPSSWATSDRESRSVEEIAYLEECDAEWRAENPNRRFDADDNVEKACDCELDMMQKQGVTIADMRAWKAKRQAMTIQAPLNSDLAQGDRSAILQNKVDSFDMKKTMKVAKVKSMTLQCSGVLSPETGVSTELMPTFDAVRNPLNDLK